MIHITAKTKHPRAGRRTCYEKIISSFIILTLIFAFTGCTSSNNEAAEDIAIKTQEVVTSNTDDDDDNISNTENAVENCERKGL